MPNFHTEMFQTPTVPNTFNQTSFVSIAKGQMGDELVLAECENKKFLLQILQKKRGFLVKGDKITKPSQVAILQQALRDLRDFSKTNVTSSNIDSKKNHVKKPSKYLKGIDYFANEFNAKQDILLEIGFGSGRHLLYQAKQNPTKTIIGLEIHKPSIEQVIKQCDIQGINNILLVDYDARVFLEFLPSNSVEKIFVHFPVPWDKKPHRRVISQSFVTQAQRVLSIGGALELRTDSENYFRYSFETFIAQSNVDLHVKKNQDLAISSKYEDRWKRQEKDIYDISMFNAFEDEEVKPIGKLTFSKGIEFASLKKKFKEVTLKEDGFFVHFESIYSISEEEGLIKVSFGASHANEHAYVHIKKDGIQYLPDNILATQNNQKAHKKIEELLHGICN